MHQQGRPRRRRGTAWRHRSPTTESMLRMRAIHSRISDRLARARILSHDHRAHRVDFTGNVVDIGLAGWFELTGYAPLDLKRKEEAPVLSRSSCSGVCGTICPRHWTNGRGSFAASRARFSGPIRNAAFRTEYAPLTGDRYEIAFSCVPHGVPLTLAYEPRIDLPPTPPVLGRVVAARGLPLSTDEYGRAWVQLLGLNPDDHPDGVGTSGTPARQRTVASAQCVGEVTRYGVSFPLRPGMLVVLDSLGGDPDRLLCSHTRPRRHATVAGAQDQTHSN